MKDVRTIMETFGPQKRTSRNGMDINSTKDSSMLHAIQYSQSFY